MIECPNCGAEMAEEAYGEHQCDPAGDWFAEGGDLAPYAESRARMPEPEEASPYVGLADDSRFSGLSLLPVRETEPGSWIRQVALREDGRVAAVGLDNGRGASAVHLVDLITSSVRVDRTCSPGEIRDLVFLRNGDLAVLQRDGRPFVLSCESRSEEDGRLASVMRGAGLGLDGWREELADRLSLMSQGEHAGEIERAIVDKYGGGNSSAVRSVSKLVGGLDDALHADLLFGCDDGSYAAYSHSLGVEWLGKIAPRGFSPALTPLAPAVVDVNWIPQACGLGLNQGEGVRDWVVVSTLGGIVALFARPAGAADFIEAGSVQFPALDPLEPRRGLGHPECALAIASWLDERGVPVTYAARRWVGSPLLVRWDPREFSAGEFHQPFAAAPRAYHPMAAARRVPWVASFVVEAGGGRSGGRLYLVDVIRRVSLGYWEMPFEHSMWRNRISVALADGGEMVVCAVILGRDSEDYGTLNVLVASRQ